MRLQLVVTPGEEGWRVCDEDDRLPVSWYDGIDEALRDARDYLLHRGGGTLTVREGSVVVSQQEVRPAGSGADP